MEKGKRLEGTVETINCEGCGKEIEVALEWWWDTDLNTGWKHDMPDDLDRNDRLCGSCLDKKMESLGRAREYMSDSPPKWFDPAYAGEHWDANY